MSAASTNGINPQDAQRWLGEALRVYDALDEQKIENMNRAREIRSRLPAIYESAKNAGLPVRALKLSIKKVLLDRKIEGLQEDIEELKPDDEDDAEAYAMLQEALGDFAGTPLGAVTLDAAAAKSEKAAAKKAAKALKAAMRAGDVTVTMTVPESDQAAADAALTQQNVERLQAGISELPSEQPPPSEPFEDDAQAAKPSRRKQRAEKLDQLTH